jgi:hypothetical protein
MEPNAKRPRAPRLLLLWPALSRQSRAPWATGCRPEGRPLEGPTLQKGWGSRKSQKSRSLGRDFVEQRKQDAFAWGRPRDDSDLARASRREHSDQYLGRACRLEALRDSLEARDKSGQGGATKKAKADPSRDFVDAQELLMSMTFARRNSPRDDSDGQEHRQECLCQGLKPSSEPKQRQS